MKAILREPLLHFTLLAVALFFAHDRFAGPAQQADPRTIIVGRNELLTFLQYRSRAFDQEHFSRVLDALTPAELQQLIHEYVREEALVREARALQLDTNDYVVRSRLIQRLEFIVRGFADAQAQLTQGEIRQYYEAHKSDYWINPQVTFTHVFFSRERHGAREALWHARTQLRELNRARVGYQKAPGFGDRFLYNQNYVASEPEEIAEHFGQAMQAQLFALTPSRQVWVGPFESPFGFHIVLLVGGKKGHFASLEEVRPRVEREATEAARDARFEQSLQPILDTYKVVLDPLRSTAAPAAADNPS
jgi:hypothetical protein